MNEPIVLIITSDNRWQTRFKPAFGNSTTPHFAENYQAALPLIKNQLIGCVIIPTQIYSLEDLKPINAFKNRFPYIPLILYGDIADKELAVEAGKIGIEAYFETNKMKELVARVQGIIEQRSFKIDFSQFGIDVERCPVTIKRALKIIAKEFLKIKTVTEIAEKINISVSHFRHQFTQYCGISCKKLLSILNLTYILYLKERTKLSITRTVNELNLIELHTFYRLFNRITGVSFSSFKNKYSSEEWLEFVMKNMMKKSKLKK